MELWLCQAELKEFKFSTSSKSSSLHPLLNKTGGKVGGGKGPISSLLVGSGGSSSRHGLGRTRASVAEADKDLEGNIDIHLAVGPKTRSAY